MHVLVLPKWYPGRTDPQLGDFIRKQLLAVAGKHRVSMIYPCPDKNLGPKLEVVLDERGGIWELRCYYRPNTSPIVWVRRALNYFRYRRSLRAGVARLLDERGRPDLVHAHILTRAVLAACTLSRRWHIPYIISEQSSVYLDGTWQRKSPIAKAIDRRLFRNAAHITAVSAHLAAALENAGLGKDHAVVPNWVPGMDKPLPLAGPAGTFMMVADLVDRTKNVSGALRALAAARALGHDLRLEVIGDGDDREMLHHLAAELDLTPYVHWHGRTAQSDVLPRMATIGTVIINSNVETFSVVTGEALASGKPVIATRCGGPEQFITVENGLLIPVLDDAALAKAMIQMSQTHHHYPPEVVRDSIRGRFGTEAVAEGFDTVYKQALAHG